MTVTSVSLLSSSFHHSRAIPGPSFYCVHNNLFTVPRTESLRISMCSWIKAAMREWTRADTLQANLWLLFIRMQHASKTSSWYGRFRAWKMITSSHHFGIRQLWACSWVVTYCRPERDECVCVLIKRLENFEFGNEWSACCRMLPGRNRYTRTCGLLVGLQTWIGTAAGETTRQRRWSHQPRRFLYMVLNNYFLRFLLVNLNLVQFYI
jgi:hypothetical protein